MVDRNLKTEYDQYGNRIHYVTKDNIHPEKYMEVWCKYIYPEGFPDTPGYIDCKVYKIKFDDDHIQEWK